MSYLEWYWRNNPARLEEIKRRQKREENMGNDIVRLVKGQLIANGQAVERRAKALVFLLIDVSASMKNFTRSAPELPSIRQFVDNDGGKCREISSSDADAAGLKTKLQCVTVGASIFAERALSTKMVGVILFGSSAQVYAKTTSDKEKLMAAISSIENHPLVGGSTNMSEALGLLLVNHCPFVETVVVVTDGHPDDKIKASKQGQLLKEKGTEILVIGTEDADWTFLNELKSEPGSSVRTSDEGLTQAITDATRLLKP